MQMYSHFFQQKKKKKKKKKKMYLPYFKIEILTSRQLIPSLSYEQPDPGCFND